VPKSAFDIALEFSAVGIIGMWSMIMNLALGDVAGHSARGLLERQEFRLPGAPYTNFVHPGVPALRAGDDLVRRPQPERS